MEAKTQKFSAALICLLILFTITSIVEAQVEFREHRLRQGFDGAQSIHCADIDGDGDEDITAVCCYGDDLAWWENNGEQEFEEHMIDANYDGAAFVIPLDFDQDGDIDLVTSARSSGVGWWENDGDQNFERRNIGPNHSCWEIHVHDIDSDDDWDVVAAGRGVVWYENDGDQNFREIAIADNFGDSRSVHADDIDSDGDIDIVASDHSNRMCAWWENDGDQNFEQHIFTQNAPQAWDIMSWDLDEDGDVDILCAIEGRQTIAWWENDGDENFEEHVIDNNCPTAGGVYVGDIDVDGDLDVLGACYGSNTIDWYQNDGDENFREFNIGQGFGNPWRVYPHDIDFDGDLDVFGAAWGGDELRWWENLTDPAPPEPEVDPNPFEVVVPFPLEDENILTITNVGAEDSELRFNLWDEGEGIDWLSCDPTEGILELDEMAEIICTFTTEELEPGEFERTIFIRTNAREFREIEVPVVMSVIVGYGQLSGTITDPATENPIEGALLTVERFDFEAVSDEDGEYIFEEIPEWIYTINIQAEDYLPQRIEEVEVIEDEVTVLDLELLHSICDLSIENIVEELDVNEEIEVDFTLTNPGNGPLTWAANLVFPEGMDADPWELRVDVPGGVITEDSRIQGAVFLNDNFYLSGANNRDPVMYVLNRDQDLVGQYGQLGEGRYGYKDIACDGELIWGSGERVIYGFAPDGEEVTSFNSGISPCNNLAWDSDREILWASGTTTDIAGFDRDGNQIAEVSRHDLRVYGLAYWPDDPDGYQLYLFHKINEVGDMMIAKVDIENDEVMDVISLEHEAGGVAQGCFITNQYDFYSWVFMGVANNGAEDRIDIWHLEANTGWVEANPMEGILEAGDELEIIVSLNTLDFPFDLEFTVDLVFRHDGVGGESIIPISLTAVGEGGGGPEERTIALNSGWNMISVNVESEEQDIVALTQTLVDQELLELMKNGVGQFYSPAFGFNNIPGWDVAQGYLMKVTEDCELMIEGVPVGADQPLPLEQGWQMIAYFPRVEVDAVIALSGVVDVLEMAKDGAGRFYSPAFGFSNMGNMREGQGYMVKMSEAVELIYTIEERIANLTMPDTPPEYLPIHPITGENMSLLILTAISEGEIGVYSDECLIGSGVLQNGICGLAIWGDDPTTSEIDGALNGETFDILFQDGSGQHEIEIEILSGENRFKTNGLLAINILGINVLPDKFGIVEAYPNPFNSYTTITYKLPEASNIRIELFDLEGRQVNDLVSEHLKAGEYSYIVDGRDLTSGIYILRLQANEKVFKHKIMLIK